MFQAIYLPQGPHCISGRGYVFSPGLDHGGETERQHAETFLQLLQGLVSCPLTRGLLLASTAQAPAGKTPALSDPLRDFISVPHLPLPMPAGCSLPAVHMLHLDCKILRDGPLCADQVKPTLKAQHTAGCHRSQHIPHAAVLYLPACHLL